MVRHLACLCIALLIALPAAAETPREILFDAAFRVQDKRAALAQIDKAEQAATAALARTPHDREAFLIRAMAIGYRAKLNSSRSSALEARQLFDSLAAADPQDAEAQALVGGWHIDAVAKLGGLAAGAMLGARKKSGFAAIDRAVALGGERAMFPGIALLLRLSLDPRDPTGPRLAQMAAQGTTPSTIDRIMQRAALEILAQLRTGDSRAVQAAAKRLLPFGRVGK